MSFLRIPLAALTALLLLVPAASAAEKTVVMRAGPYDLSGFQTLKPKVLVDVPKTDGHITYMFSRLVDGSGKPINIQRVMLHHVVFLNQGRFPGDRKTKCGARFGEPFYGTGEETQALDLPQGYGYRTRPGDKWKMQTMLMSHSPRPQRVYVEYRMKIDTSKSLTPVTPYWVRVTNCKNEPSYSVPGGGKPGSVHLRTRLWTMPQNGRIVAGGAHLHGGSHNITLRQPACSGRRLMASDPTYGAADYISYNVRPILHEPGPINTAWYTSRQGIPVRKGELLRVTANYDAQYPHPGVMGVYHIYVAAGKPPASKCPALPRDAKEVKISSQAVRDDPPRVVVPLTALNDAGVPVTIDHPFGKLFTYEDPLDEPTVNVDKGEFSKVNLSIPEGGTVTWTFNDPEPHKVSLANGPRSVGSPTLTGGREWSRTFGTPGTYQLFCYLHPMTMHQEVVVRPRPGQGPASDGTGQQGPEDDGDFY